MLPIENPAGFIVAVVVFQLIPGPGSLNLLRATANHGTRAGFAAMAGTLLGGLLCMLAAAFGMEAVFRGRPEAIGLLQSAGAAYLAWMGLRLIDRPRAAAANAAVPVGLGRHLGQALAISLANPKVILFYFALLPLFFRGPMTPAALLAMVGCVSGISLLYQSALVVAGRAAAERLARLPQLRRLARQLAGLVLVGFAARLLVG